MIQFEWKDLAWMLGVSTLLGGTLIAFIRWKLAGDFARSADVARIDGRLAMVEARLERMPSHDDLRTLEARVGGLEREVVQVGERLAGATEIMKRVEHQTNLLVQHQLTKERG